MGIAVLVALHNIGQIEAAELRLASVQAEHVVNGCIVYGDGTSSGFCPGASQPAPTEAAPPGVVLAQPVSGNPQAYIDADLGTAKSDLASVRAAQAPERRADLTLAMLGGVPGIGLALVLGALLTGSEYQWGTTRTTLLAARSRTRLVLARTATVWTIVLAWLMAAVVAAQATYALAGPHAGLARFGTPSLSPSIALGAWLSLGLFASVAGALAAVMRSALGAATAGLALVAVLRFVPLGASTCWFDPLRAVGRLLTPEPVFVSMSSGASLTAAYGMPSGAGPAPSTLALVLGLAVASVVVLALTWLVSERQEVR